MLPKLKASSFKKLAKKIGITSPKIGQPSQHELLLREVAEDDESKVKLPAGFFAVYVGEERQRFVVPTAFLSHPLFRMLLEKASEEFGFQPQNGLVIPCSVSAFREVANAVECRNGKFQFGQLVQELM